MCGIAGCFGQQIKEDVANAWKCRLRHRGPDAEGVWMGDGAFLVHTRLAILDLSEAGAQPMGYEESRNWKAGKGNDRERFRYWLVFNGEIYNHVQLRKELEAQGERFHGNSDTEVLLRLLIREGERSLRKLAGMFAFAFWDEEKKEGLLARDTFGIKPLYYAADGHYLAFASETRVLRPELCSKLDSTAIRDFLMWGSVQEPDTLFSGLKQLSAGHCLQWRRGLVSVSCWSRTDRNGGEPAQDYALATREALLESVSRHLVSDVPVGIFLSGGIDSTALLALARKAVGPAAELRTFSIGFDSPDFDESFIARRSAEHFGTKHTEWRMSSAEGEAEIPGYLRAMDQPTNDGFNTWCVSKLARQEGLKVVVSGLGGDEFFGGYRSFFLTPVFSKLFHLLGPGKWLAAWGLSNVPIGSPWRRLADFLRGSGTRLSAYHAQRGIFTEEEARKLTNAATGEDPGPVSWEDPDILAFDERSLIGQFEICRYMRNQLLRDSDVFSMAHGLELRVPLVDRRLAEFLLNVPPQVRLGQGKQLLIKAVPEIPEWVRSHPKRGFRFPFQQWIEDSFGNYLQEASRFSPVPLLAWYRTWTVAALLRTIRS